MDRREFLAACGSGAGVAWAGMAGADVQVQPGAEALARPTREALEWADCEIGVILHLDIPIFEPGYKWRKQWGYHPDAKIYNPSQLDTDQWMEVIRDLGAKYAVLVAKHCTGFALWPTTANDYSVQSSPWRQGKGDIVADFTTSCRRYGIRPGLYYSSAANAYYLVDNPGRVITGDQAAQQRYNRVVVQQLTELWTNYGEIFEIWFDGGALPPSQGGPDLAPLVSLQPNAIYFQGPPQVKNLIRWAGNERGVAPDPDWSTADNTTNSAGNVEIKDLHGDPAGKIWCPAEADTPLRKWRSFMQGWGWKKGQDSLIKSQDHLDEIHLTSVGRNANLLLGVVIDDRGLVPDVDCAHLKAFGDRIRGRFSNPIAETSGREAELTLDIAGKRAPTSLVIMEDIAQGQRIRQYSVECSISHLRAPIIRGRSVGHKRIHKLPPLPISRLTLRVEKSVGEPVIRKLAVY